MDGAEPAGRSSSVVTALRLVRERWLIIVVAAVVCGGVAFALAKRATKEYQATATLLSGTTGSNLSGVLNANASNVSADPQRDQGTALLLVTSDAVAKRVKQALKLPDSPSDLSGEISASAQPDANLIDVTATDPDPARAAQLANAFANQYAQFRQDTDRAGVEKGILDLQKQIAQTPASQTAGLTNALSQLYIVKASSNGGVQVVDQAAAPTSPSSPRPTRNAALGVLLGIVLGVAIVFARDLFDRRLRGVSDFESLYRMQALTTVPLRSRAPRTDRERAAALEPFRILRSGLTMLDPDGEVRVVMITSAVPGEGKSQTATGLAQALAVAGMSVALVEADLRRPSFHRQFDLGTDQRGLTNALVDGIPARELMRTVVPGLPNLQALPSGGTPPNSGELLRSSGMFRILRELADGYDMVILDAAPLLPVADTQGLLDASGIDACLVVAHASKTTRDEVVRTRAILDRHRQRHLGLVVNGVRGPEVHYDYYSEPGELPDRERQGAPR